MIMALKLTSHGLGIKYADKETKESNCYDSGILQPYAMRGDTKIEEVEILGFKQICTGAFQDCTSLTCVTITGPLHRIDCNAFVGCTALQKIILPASLEEVEVELGIPGVAKLTLFNPSSDELIENLKQGYAIDLYYKDEYRDDHWD